MTPAELNLMASVYYELQHEKFEKDVTLAWLGEMYHRQDRLPPLKQCLEDLKPKEVVNGIVGGMTDDAMLEMVKKLNKQFGGVEG